MIDRVPPPRPPAVETKRKPVKMEKEPDLRLAGRVVPPDHPAYRIIRKMILRKYGMDK